LNCFDKNSIKALFAFPSIGWAVIFTLRPVSSFINPFLDAFGEILKDKINYGDNIYQYFKEKGKVEIYFSCFAQIASMLHYVEELEKMNIEQLSPYVENLKKAYKSVDINEKLNIKSVHITVETGFFKDKINDLDVAIISPKILNAHTTKECVNIASVYKCDKWLQNFLNIV